MTRIPVLALLLSTIVASHALAAVHVTPEQAIASPSPAPPEGQQYIGAIASDGTDFLVAWSGVTGLQVMPVTADGRIAGPRTPISSSASAIDVSACWTGFAYLISWTDPGGVNVATVSRDGALVTSPSLIVPAGRTRSGSLAWNGKRAFLAYKSSAGPVKGATLNLSGSVLTLDVPMPVTDILSSLQESVPRVATDGSEFLLAWRSGESVPITIQADPPPLMEMFHTFHVLRVDGFGKPIGAAMTVGRVEQTGDFGVAFGNGQYVIVATETHLIKPGYTLPRLVRFMVDPYRRTAVQLPDVDNVVATDVIWNGSRFVAFWLKYSNSSFELDSLSFTGGEESSAPAVTRILSGPHVSTFSKVGWNGTNMLAVWSEDVFDCRCGQTTLRGAILDPSAQSSAAPFDISIGTSRQFAPSIASSGGESLVVWIDSDRPSGGRLLGLRTTPFGVPLDPAPFEIALNASLANPPQVVFAGDVYLVVWREDNSPVYARTVARDGALGTRITIGGGWGVTVASSGTMALVVFRSTSLVGYRFDSRGKLLDTAPINLGDGVVPKAASNGSDFFVAFDEGSDYWQFPSRDLVDVLGVRVAANGAVDAAPIAIATGPRDQRVAAVGSDGRDYIVFYQLDEYQQATLAAKRVLREGQLDGTAGDDGTVVGPVLNGLSVAPGNAGGYWIAGTTSYSTGSVQLIRTDSHGGPLETVTLASFASPMNLGGSVSLTQAADGPLQIAYARRMIAAPYTSTLFVRWLTDSTERSRPSRR